MTDADRGFVYDGGTLTLEDYLTRWLKDSVEDTVRRSTSPSTRAWSTGTSFPPLVVSNSSLLPLHTHAPSTERSWIPGSAPRTVQYVHVTLHKALKQAVLDGMIPRNVADAVKAPRAHKKEVKPLTPVQVAALLSAASGDHLEALYVTAVHTGLRRGELLGLKWTDLDLDARTLSVQRSLDKDGTFNPPKAS